MIAIRSKMKGIYLILIILSIIIVAMIISAFFYLDLQRRQTFLYALYQNDTLVGYEKIDKYRLENRQIYKSFAELPRHILHNKIERKISFDVRGKVLIDCKKEILHNGARSISYILNGPKRVSFMTSENANFLYLDNIATYGNDLFFENDAVVTYQPIIRRYNFKRGGVQYVNVLTPILNFLPPVRKVAYISAIGKDIIEIDGREINCERIILRLKNDELISIWASGRFHNVLMVDVPKNNFRAVFCTEKKSIPVQEYKKKSELYKEKEVAFTNEEVTLSGTLSVPTDGKPDHPACMLIWDSGPMDRNALGIFTDLAHALAEAGYCVLRFDKRGIGRSQGFFSTYDQSEEISDLKCAIDFLKSLPEVDKSRIALLGYSEGGFYASYMAGASEDVRACIIMSALSSLSPLKNDCIKLKKFIRKFIPDDEEYLKSAIIAVTQSREMTNDKSDWITILGNRVFTRKMYLENKYNMLDTLKKVKVPVLILHGRKDSINLIEEASELGDALADTNDDFTMIYFGELDHFFGTAVTNPPTRDHIEADRELLKSIITWLDNNLVALPTKAAISVDEGIKNEELQKAPVEGPQETQSKIDNKGDNASPFLLESGEETQKKEQ